MEKTPITEMTPAMCRDWLLKNDAEYNWGHVPDDNVRDAVIDNLQDFGCKRQDRSAAVVMCLNHVSCKGCEGQKVN